MKMKKILGLLLGAFLCFSNVLITSAKEKQMSVPIKAYYKQVIFYFDFTDNESHMITITTPNGNVVNQNVTTSSVAIPIEDAEKGDYSILIENDSDNEIEVSARAECSNSTAQDVGSNLTVSSALTNVTTFFVDGDLCVKWDDTGLGKVNIVVTNPKTMQRIKNDTTDGTSYRCSIPSSVESVEVYLVPATSAKIKNAGSVYTLDVVREINSSLIMPEINLVNEDNLNLTVDFPEETTVLVSDNDEYVYQEKYPSGTNEITIPVNYQDNRFVVYLANKDNNMISYSFSIEKDLVAPTLKFSNTYDGMKTEDTLLILKGYAEGASHLFINDKEVEIQDYGYFTFDYHLDDGDNKIVVSAIDDAKNNTSVTLSVVKELPKSSPIGMILAIVFGLIIIGAFIYYFVKHPLPKKNKGVVADKEERREKNKTIAIKKESEKKEITSKTVKVKNADSNNRKQQIDKPVKLEVKRLNKSNPNKEVKQKSNKNSKSVVINSAVMRLKRKSERRNTIVNIGSICFRLGLIFIFFNLLIRNTIVASGSMEPTLKTKDIAVYNKIAYTFTEIQRGDIISFWSEEYNENFSKRVIGVPGDTIEFHDGYVFINDKKVDESLYILPDVETNCTKTFTVPENTVFVMGDNREDSVDSRFFTNPYIPFTDIEGKYIGTIPNIFK